MNSAQSKRLFAWALVPALVCGFMGLGFGAPPEEEQAKQILAAAGVKGGLIVHLGCGDGKLTAGLRANDSYLVQGLDADAKNVEAARQHIQSLGLYGKVSVEQWTANRFPYTDNLVNLLVCEYPGEGVAEPLMAEIRRVLVPNGVALFRNPKSNPPAGGQNQKFVKPWPKEIDEWTHFLHDASNNAVAQDSLVGPPKRIQWVEKPLYCRSHEIDSSVSALVSAQGRIFYILDEGLTGITDPRLPEQWALIARDAFNGVLLWKKPIARWGWPEWKKEQLEGKDWTTLTGQRGHFPAELSRRLVAHGDRVFVTLGYAAPVTVLDAATGEIVRTFEETEGTDEILFSDGRLVLRRRDLSSDQEKHRTGKPILEGLLAAEADTGKIVWNKETGKIQALCLAVDGGRVFFCSGKEIVCMSLKDGEEAWRAAVAPVKKKEGKPAKGAKQRKPPGGYTLVAQDGVVLLLSPDQLIALSAERGQTLWTEPGARGPGAIGNPDLFVTDGLVWVGKPVPGLGADAEGPQKKVATGALLTGYDLKTGEVKKTVEVPNAISAGHHFRCYRSKATERYILWPKRGVEFLDLEGADHMRQDWLRPPCKLGVMPCNGLLYVPPHQCFCYPGVKLMGFLALSAQTNRRPDDKRFEQGPAYDQIQDPKSKIQNENDWPTYRHDPKRSGSTTSTVPAEVKTLWQSHPGGIGGKLTSAVVAEGTLYVGSVDAHTVHALNAQDGKPLWSYTAGGRVDSPPTIYQGLVLFGSAYGWVYCLRASDGQLAWRFRAAPEERRVAAFGQVESAWSVHGSVLILNGIAYCSAGRSSYLDGGIFLYGLDPKTGKLLHEGRIEGPYPDLTKDIGRPFDMEGTFSDVLVTDGTHLYMQQIMLDDKLAQQEAPRLTNMGDRKVGRHIFSTAGFLDDSWFNRTFWMYSERWPGYYIANQSPKAGQLLVFDSSTTYGVKVFTHRNCHSPMYFPGKEGCLLFADDNETEPVLLDEAHSVTPVKWLPYEEYSSSRGWTKIDSVTVDKDKGVGFTRTRPPKWSAWVPVRVRAMALAGDTLFIAGPPDILEPEDPLASFEGRMGGLLWAVSPADGKKLAEYKLDSPPAFDGMIAANGRLYVSDTNGRLICMGAK